jgi:predicted nucleotidyltransferase
LAQLEGDFISRGASGVVGVLQRLLTFIELENYLSDTLGIKVDLVMKDSLKPKIGEHILREAVPV